MMEGLLIVYMVPYKSISNKNYFFYFSSFLSLMQKFESDYPVRSFPVLQFYDLKIMHLLHLQSMGSKLSLGHQSISRNSSIVYRPHNGILPSINGSGLSVAGHKTFFTVHYRHKRRYCHDLP